MKQANDPDSPLQNRILAALSNAEYDRLADDLKIVCLKLGQVLFEPGDKLDYIYFPTTAIISRVFTTADGSLAELAMTGNDGFIGTALALGGETTNDRTVVQSTGTAYRAGAEVVRWEFDQNGELKHLALRHVQALMTQMAQNVVCNRHHSISQQLCRMLLLCLDRKPGNQLEMTHERIANLLGVRREGITEAAGHLQAAGLIRYSRGRIEVTNRPGLEARVCECYAVVKRETERLFLPANLRVRNPPRANPATLRQRAETRLQQTPPGDSGQAQDNTRLMHELQVHQIELEMQHEALRNAYAESDTLRERYADIYDFGPVGYLTLGRDGIILDLNLAGAILLGITRSQKNRRRFDASIKPEHHAAFRRFLEQVLDTKGPHRCEIELMPTGNDAGATVRIEAVPDENCAECRMVLIDITAEKLAGQALRTRDHYQRALLDNFPFMVWLKDEHSHFLAANSALARECGAPSAEALIGKADIDFASPARAAVYLAEDRAVLAGGQTMQSEQMFDEDGLSRWLEVYKSPIRIDGQTVGTVGFARDVTERHLTLQALAESEAQHRRIMEKLPLSAAVMQDGLLVYVNPKALELSGYSLDECIGQPFLPFIDEADHAMVLAAHELRLHGGPAPHDYEMRLLGKDGRNIDCHAHFSIVKWNERTATLVIFDDITEQKRIRAELKNLESIDFLTLLANRRHFIERMEEALSQVHRETGYQVALLLIDLDGGKAVDNSPDRSADDAMLQLFSTFLRPQLRKADVGGRIGDRRFAVLLPTTSQETAAVFAERLRQKATQVSATLQNRTLSLSLRIGVASIDPADGGTDQVLARADEALQRACAGVAKAAGRKVRGKRVAQ